MKTLTLLLLLVLPACGYDLATVCESTHYGHVESVLEMRCDTFEDDAEAAVQAILSNTAIDEHVLRSRMMKGQVTVRSVSSWEEGFVNSDVAGYTTGTHISVEQHGWTLAHETLHLYDIVGLAENLATILAAPVEAPKEMNHDGWDTNGYYAASLAYFYKCIPLQPLRNTD
jgi:hypothetical protein